LPGQVDINSVADFHDMLLEADVSYDIEEIKRVFGRRWKTCMP